LSRALPVKRLPRVNLLELSIYLSKSLIGSIRRIGCMFSIKGDECRLQAQEDSKGRVMPVYRRTLLLPFFGEQSIA